MFDVFKKFTSDNNLLAKNNFVSSVFLCATKRLLCLDDSKNTFTETHNVHKAGSKYGFILLLFFALFLGTVTSVQAAQTPCSAIGGVLDGALHCPFGHELAHVQSTHVATTLTGKLKKI